MSFLDTGSRYNITMSEYGIRKQECAIIIFGRYYMMIYHYNGMINYYNRYILQYHVGALLYLIVAWYDTH